MSVQSFQRHQLPVTPWKNGGGSTCELACWPPGAGLHDFGWRISIASIAAAGPFSVFPGIDRSIMLLAGNGVQRCSHGRHNHTWPAPPHRRPYKTARRPAAPCWRNNDLLHHPSLINAMTAMTFHTTEPAFRFRQGTQPLLISMPHVGTHVPPALAARFTPEAQEVHDTDWHLDRLYDFADELGASVLVATHSRYVVDLNRPPDGASLYPGQNVTGLCPVDTFASTPLYASGSGPDEAEITIRRDTVWAPYHQQLRAELDRIRAAHGVAVLWDAHSIRSVVPRFFEGKLPDLNLGTANGASCNPALANELLAIAESANGYSAVLNGRFQGGHITRHYGQPQDNIHAVQLEMTQSSYMQETMPFDYLPERATGVQPHLRRMIEAALAFAQSRAVA